MLVFFPLIYTNLWVFTNVISGILSVMFILGMTSMVKQTFYFLVSFNGIRQLKYTYFGAASSRYKNSLVASS